MSTIQKPFVKVKSVRLVNYCGYTDSTFDFSDGGGVKRFATFFGPNGIGKTTCLHAVRMAGNAGAFRGRERTSDLIMRKSIHDEEYLPTVDMVSNKVKNDMRIVVTFVTHEGDKEVVLDNLGLLKNELPTSTLVNGYVYFADADNPMNTQKFLLAEEHKDRFIDFAKAVYGYECDLAGYVNTQGLGMFTDFVIKKGTVKVHYKSMSAGEKKIATLVSDLCQPINTEGRDVILIDNVEMHVYYKRHTRMIDKLLELFPDKQIITTTHSSVVIDHLPPEYKYDLEVYRPDYRLLETADDLQDSGNPWSGFAGCGPSCGCVTTISLPDWSHFEPLTPHAPVTIDYTKVHDVKSTAMDQLEFHVAGTCLSITLPEEMALSLHRPRTFSIGDGPVNVTGTGEGTKGEATE